MVMFAFTAIISTLFLVFGFSELREIFRGKDKSTAAPAMGTIYFFICTLLWFVLAMWWPAMATDAALGTLGILWLGFGFVSFALAWACVGFIIVRSGNKDERSKLEIREENRNEGY
jgi:hypothetical protein